MNSPVNKTPKLGKANDTKAQRVDSRSNLVGKFTQSVKRIVQEVKEEGVPADGDTRDEAIETNQRLRGVRMRLTKSTDTVRQALLGLHQQYYGSKQTLNVFSRYTMLKTMIKSVVKLEKEYWHLLEIPKQEKQESVYSYVLRACAIFEKNLSHSQRGPDTHEKRLRTSEEEQRKLENAERLHGMTTSQIFEENQMLTNELYRQLRKYSSLRSLMKELADDYRESKIYPVIPRYFMLKAMIRDIMTDSAFLDVCHEVNQPTQPPPANHSAAPTELS